MEDLADGGESGKLVLETLIEGLADSDPEVVKACKRALLYFDQNAVPLLQQAALRKHTSVQVQQRLMDVVVQLNDVMHDPEKHRSTITPALVTCVRSNRPALREKAITLLRVIPNHDAAERLATEALDRIEKPRQFERLLLAATTFGIPSYPTFLRLLASKPYSNSKIVHEAVEEAIDRFRSLRLRKVAGAT